jgi:hypothetical protein
MQVASGLRDAGERGMAIVPDIEPDTGNPRPWGWHRFDLSADAVRRRFQWAKRRGQPAWLWPNVKIEEWRGALGLIEEVVRKILQGEAPPALGGEEQAVGLACYTSGVGPLLGWWLKQGRLWASPTIASLLELHLLHNACRQERVSAVAREVVRTLSERGIAVLVLKGLHTGTDYFPDPATRPLSDVDILINPADASAAETALLQSGFVERGRNARESNWAPAGMARQPRSLMLVHAEDPWSIDLHTTLDLAVGEGSPLAALSKGSPMTGHSLWTPDPCARVLDQPLLALHLAVHASAGLHSLSLLRLIELHFVIAQDSTAELLSWDEFMRLGAQTGALGFAFPALRLCEDLVPGTIPYWVLHGCAAAAPARARRVVSKLTPATAQRVERSWVSEHYMWVQGWRGWVRQLASDLVPSARSWRTFRAIYERRMWRLLRGRIDA